MTATDLDRPPAPEARADAESGLEAFLRNPLVVFTRAVGQQVLNFLTSAGRLSIFAILAISHCARPPIYFRTFLNQLMSIGYYSLPVVGLTAIFTGMVLVLQSYVGFSRFNAENTIALVVAISITRELGPVLAGLMVAGRVGAAIAAEIGTMRVTEQIDALKTLSTDPMKYLVAPRVLAGVIALPILVLIADTIGIFGGFLIGVYALDFNAVNYVQSTIDFLQPMDIISGLVKAAAFGLIITILGCYNGFHSGRGAQGVGRSTTNAVVGSSMLILVANYFLTRLFFSG